MHKKHLLIHLLIALLAGLGILFGLRPDHGLTSTGVAVLAITIPTLYLWLTVNTHWCALLFLALLVMTRAMTANEVWAGSVGHFAVITMIVFSLFNYCLKETGVIDRVASWFITRPFLRGRPYLFLAMFFLSNLVIGMFVDNLSLAVIYVGIAVVLAKTIGVEKGNSFYTCLFIGILWCNVVISIASPIAHAPVLILIGMMEAQLGIVISYGQWLSFGVPFAILMFLVMLAAISIWKPDTSAFLNFDFDGLARQNQPLSRRGKLTAGVFAALVFTILFPELFKGIFPALCGYLSAIGVVAPAILALTLLCILRVENRPVLDMPEAMKTLPMSAILFAGVVCVMSVPISSPATGISLWLGNILQPAFHGLPGWLIVAALTAAALIMTNFLSNVVTMVLFFNIGLALLSGGSVHLGGYAIIIGFASSMATLTPSACAPAPLVFAPGHVSVRGVLKANLVFLGFALVIILALLYPAASMLPGI